MTVLPLTWKSPYVDKTVFILRRGPAYFTHIFQGYFTASGAIILARIPMLQTEDYKRVNSQCQSA